MSVNKTTCSPIALRSRAEPAAHLRVKVHSCGDFTDPNCNCCELQNMDDYRYLGVVIDKQLKWDKHVESIKIKLRKYIYVFNILSNILNHKEIKSVYFSYVQSVIQYGIIVYAGSLQNIIDPLSVIQNQYLNLDSKKINNIRLICFSKNVEY